MISLVYNYIAESQNENQNQFTEVLVTNNNGSAEIVMNFLRQLIGKYEVLNQH